ncbi:GNAT family N-acetyltransferase [Acanthopleuribacter pedis]|uniref:GNAT family N-acetyltransferase n=1 Tax=Acanthopleuribacter pedis TaxID=442870 RepID=A0A8J7Q835_9BACT|nr:GNAT family N-acetyltransferase [Acanthopleuribacter pedis]MBO1319407.1 GNAT family N-acetyltransferase [Acanthopleuribacter pedis]
MIPTTFRAFQASDVQPCLALFDENCPRFFAANERDDYEHFLKTPGDYRVGLRETTIVAAFGMSADLGQKRHRLTWILVSPAAQGTGVGRQMMDQVLKHSRRQGAVAVDIAASQHSAPFFAKFGARTTRTIPNGWGAGMHRVDMVLALTE